MIEEPQKTNLEDEFKNLFKGSASGSGEEELLRIASNYSRQLTSPHMKLILWLEDHALAVQKIAPEWTKRIQNFVARWLELKQYNHSDVFVMKALEFISLRRFLNENSFKVDIKK